MLLNIPAPWSTWVWLVVGVLYPKNARFWFHVHIMYRCSNNNLGMMVLNPEAGVNDLALLQLDGSRVAALTAGDDHGLGLCIYALEEGVLGHSEGGKMAIFSRKIIGSRPSQG